MPPKSLKGREYTIYFKSAKDRAEWQNSAKECNCNLSKYILEMAALGRSKRIMVPVNPNDTALLKEEISRLRANSRDLEAIRTNLEAEVLKLRHKVFLKPFAEGDRQYSREIIDLLKSGGNWSGKDILKALHIQVSDSEAVEIIVQQLHGLKAHGLVEEDGRGWRWIS